MKAVKFNTETIQHQIQAYVTGKQAELKSFEQELVMLLPSLLQVE